MFETSPQSPVIADKATCRIMSFNSRKFFLLSKASTFISEHHIFPCTYSHM